MLCARVSRVNTDLVRAGCFSFLPYPLSTGINRPRNVLDTGS